VGIAAACALPNLGWQVAHGWPSWEFLSSQTAKTAEDTSHLDYVAQQVAFLAGALPLALVGVVVLWRRPPLRALAVLWPVTCVAYFVEQGRSYYALPAVALPLAAGVVAASRWLGASRRRRAIGAAVFAAHLALLVAVAPLVWPVLPERSMIDRGIWNDTFYKDEIGWPELVRQTAAAWKAIPLARRRDTALLAQNYGEAGTLAYFGPRLGLPAPLSGHLSWHYWRPARLPQRHVLAVGVDASELRALCTTWRAVARIDNRWQIGNEERGRTIARCALRRTLGQLWSSQIASNRL
jgi:hypothetical protein